MIKRKGVQATCDLCAVTHQAPFRKAFGVVCIHSGVCFQSIYHFLNVSKEMQLPVYRNENHTNSSEQQPQREDINTSLETQI